MNTPDLFSELSDPAETVVFVPTRRAGLDRLDKFVARTGAHYASNRNYDLGPSNRSSISALSPWIRHRLITEEEVLTNTLARHSASAAMKFIQEVFWRSYFKGWLEQHPSVWQSYQSNLDAALVRLKSNESLKLTYDDAVGSNTGIDCFDHWVRELKETGFLHNHTRMWFASIWIFTLRLPWELVADFFLRHLIDGDSASNTLSWRWVGGLHTKGKTYLARPSNIAKYTNGQFEPSGQLSSVAEPLIEEVEHEFVPLTHPKPVPSDDALLLITSEDCRPKDFLSGHYAAALGLIPTKQADRGSLAQDFNKGAVEDAIVRIGGTSAVASSTKGLIKAIIETAQSAGVAQVVTPWAAVGPVATQLDQVQSAIAREGIHLHQHRRAYDSYTWPHASKGFFKLKKKIPQILKDLGLAS